MVLNAREAREKTVASVTKCDTMDDTEIQETLDRIEGLIIAAAEKGQYMTFLKDEDIHCEIICRLEALGYIVDCVDNVFFVNWK
jgi:hypothetical protein